MIKRASVFGRVGPSVAGLALVLSAVIPASAQVPPPSRDSNEGGKVPHYVDNADYDPQPYYVDGVQYKPYKGDAKKKGKADAVKGKAAADLAQDTGDQDQAPTADLHPYVPTKAQVSSSSSSAAQSRSLASESSSTEHTVSHNQASSSEEASVDTGPKKRTRYNVAIIQALDKVTAESVRFEAPIGQPVRYKGLIYLVRACETTADDEPMQDVMAYMQVRTNPTPVTNVASPPKSKEIFHGWTFASSPGLNPLEHINYDAWVIACRKPLPG